MTRAELKSDARNQLRGNWLWAVGLSFVAWFIVYVINDIGEFISTGNDTVYRTVKYFAGGEIYTVESYNINPFGSIFTIVLSILTVVLMWGVTYTILEFRDSGDTPNILKGMFSGYTDGHFSSTLVTSILVGIFTFLWGLLLIIPGWIKAYSYSMTPYIMKDYYTSGKKPKATEAINASRKLMNGHKTDLFILDLSFLGWAILGIISCGIGFLWITPYYRQTKANFYRKLAGDQFLTNDK